MTTNTAMVYVNPGAEPAIAALAAEATLLLRSAEAKAVDSKEAVKDATDDLNLIGSIKKALEAKRKEYTTPLNDHLKTINNAFKSITEPLLQAESLMKNKVLGYHQEQARLRRAEEEINRLRVEAAQKEMELKGELTEPVALVEVRPQPSRVDRTEFSTGVVKKIWKFEVEDKANLPLEYLEPDLVKIRKVIMAGVSIPGVRAWQEDTLAVGARRYAAEVEAKALPESGAGELPF